jgi:type I restriction enzyme M protein
MSVRTLVKSIQDIMRQDSGVDGDAQRISQLCWMFFLKIIDDQDQELELTRTGYVPPIPEKFQWRNWAADPEGITGEALLAFVNGELFPALKGLQLTGKPGDRRKVVRDVFEDAYNYMKSGQLMRQVVNKISSVDFNTLADRQHFGEIYEQLLNDLQSAGNAGEYYTPRAVTAFMVDRIDPHPGEILFDPACGTGGMLTCSIRHMEKNHIRTPKQRAAMEAARDSGKLNADQMVDEAADMLGVPARVVVPDDVVAGIRAKRAQQQAAMQAAAMVQPGAAAAKDLSETRVDGKTVLNALLHGGRNE